MIVRTPFGDSMAVAVELMMQGLTTCECLVFPQCDADAVNVA
jgi:hypothetical protein